MKTNSNPCIFCLDELQQPRCLPCDHSFCTNCLERYLQVRGDYRCPLCRRGFQVSAGVPAEATAVPGMHVIPTGTSTTGAAVATNQNGNNVRSSSDYIHIFDIDLDLLDDTLVLTLTEQEVRFFADLYSDVMRDNQPQTQITQDTGTDGTWILIGS